MAWSMHIRVMRQDADGIVWFQMQDKLGIYCERASQDRPKVTILRKGRTKVRAAPLVFLSPPSSKLYVKKDEPSIPHQVRGDILLASLQCDLVLVLARSAFQSQHDLLRRLCLLHQSPMAIHQWGECR
jgi:hypothetical protein